MPQTRPINLPSSTDSAREFNFEDATSVVVVGANGSGKSRLGAWIEIHPPRGRQVHRISAQRALTFSEKIRHRSIEEARSAFLYGENSLPIAPPQVEGESAQFDEQTNRAIRQRANNRWNRNPTSHLLNDYDQLLSFMFGLERQRNTEVVNAIQNGASFTAEAIPASELDRLKEIWEDILPHRQLLTNKDSILAKTPAATEYSGLAMSDGERVILYLIGECLCAPKDAILVIDEPEIHLHQAVQGRLWDSLEAARSDCTFVYITHDLDFACGRNSTHLIWMKSYDGSNWTWQEVPEQREFPATLMLEVLGSRKPILFVEGETSSLDKLYRTLFPLHTIKARGSCSAVIRSVRSMSEPGIFTGQYAFGLIDRDRRTEVELEALRRQNVFCCPVAEVENLLCIPAILDAAASAMNCPELVGRVKEFVVREYRSEVERLAIAFACKEVRFQLEQFEEKRRQTKSELIADYEAHLGQIDIGRRCDEEKERLSRIAEHGDYMEVLKVFNRKGLVNQVAEVLGFRPKAFERWFFGTLEMEHRNRTRHGITDALKAVMPSIPTTISGE